jgi:hypothetical protein
MPIAATELFSRWTCHWSHVPRLDGRGSMLVWICEYPYRTMRSGPNEDCESCRRAMSTQPQAGRLAVPRLGAGA